MASAVPGQQHQGHVGDTYEVPAYEPHSSFAALKDRIRQHYELASDYYYSLWGQHIHHAYFQSPTDTKEAGQVNLIRLLLSISSIEPGSGSPASPSLKVLDVGCGIGGTSRFLANELGCHVTGITISGRQVSIAQRLTDEENTAHPPVPSAGTTSTVPPLAAGATPSGQNGGSVTFLELDAEKISDAFDASSFDLVWISEALSHFPNKPLFFRDAARVLKPTGKLVVADWFKAEDLTPAQVEGDIKIIEDGMLLPPLNTQAKYVRMAADAALTTLAEPKDISAEVAKTWDISWSLVASPTIWAFAISQGRDGLAFLQAFRAMRRGYANGTFRYAVMAFQKP